MEDRALTEYICARQSFQDLKDVIFLQSGARKEEEPVHIINIALQIEKNCKDVEICRKMVYEFTQSKVKIYIVDLHRIFNNIQLRFFFLTFML